MSEKVNGVMFDGETNWLSCESILRHIDRYERILNENNDQAVLVGGGYNSCS
jgi:hypothetical protein